MKTRFTSALLLTAVLGALSAPLRAVPIELGLSATTIDNSVFGYPGWTSGFQALPPSTTIGSTPLEIHVTLSDYLIAGADLGFGMGGFDVLVPTGFVAYEFSLQLAKDGVLVGSPNGFALVNPFPTDADNLGVSFGGTGIAGLEYNEIFISVTSPVERSVTNFNVSVSLPASVPDAGHTSLLVAGAFAGLIGLRRKLSAM